MAQKQKKGGAKTLPFSAGLSCLYPLYPRRGYTEVCKDEAGKRGLRSGFFSRAGGEFEKPSVCLVFPSAWRCGATGCRMRRMGGAGKKG